MTKNTHLTRTAGSAIAAALALASTPLLAQQADSPAAQPQETQPAPSPTTSTTPAIIPTFPAESAPAKPVVTIPNTLPSTQDNTATTQPRMRSEPVVQAVPAPEPEASASAERATPAETPASNEAAAAPAPRQRTAEPVATTAAPGTETGSAADTTATDPTDEMLAPVPQVAPQTVAPEIDAPVDETSPIGEQGMLTWLVATLGVAGIVLLALLMFRRRRRAKPAEKIVPYHADAQPKPALEPKAPASEGFVTSTMATAPHAETPAEPAAPVSIETARSSAPSNGLATAGASVPLPRSKPQTMEERTALIDRLAAADPDRANPFRSPKARRRRARLIVQSLDREFKNGSRIDLSQYPANWPHLARREASAVA